MQVQNGKLYENRTWKYLYPCLKHYGNELNKHLSSFLKLAVGLGDSNREENSNSIYILFDTNIPLNTEKARQDYKNKFAKFLDWISYQKYYVTDYIYDTNMHMLVLNMPEQHNNAHFYFVKGEYSKMYNVKSISEYFKYLSVPSNKELELKQNNKLKVVKSVLNKDKKYIQTFVDIVNKRFNTTVEAKYFQDAELDFPPEREEEIFNYKVGEH